MRTKKFLDELLEQSEIVGGVAEFFGRNDCRVAAIVEDGAPVTEELVDKDEIFIVSTKQRNFALQRRRKGPKS